MQHALSFLLLLVMSTASFSEPVFPESPDMKKFTPDEIPLINKFCVAYKNDLIKDLGIINNQSVSKETFALFIKATYKLKPATLEFFDTLKDLGADECNF